MKAIWKYQLEVKDEQLLSLPLGSVIRSFGAQGDEIFVWVEVDTDATETYDTCLYIRGTGMPLPDKDLDYITTVLMYQGALVWHIYTDTPPF